MSDSDASSDGAIDFYFDFSSPYGYLAAHKFDDIARLYGRTVVWRPILLGVIFKTTGAQPLLDIPIKGPLHPPRHGAHGPLPRHAAGVPGGHAVSLGRRRPGGVLGTGS